MITTCHCPQTIAYAVMHGVHAEITVDCERANQIATMRHGIVYPLVTRQAYDQVAALLDDVERQCAALRQRERCCPTMLEAEARALLRAMQEIAESVGLDGSAPPEQVVTAVRATACRTC